MRVSSWTLTQPAAPMTLATREETAGAGEVLVEVAGCGVCHTDLAFFDGSVPTRHPLPLALGHEISGRVVEAGPGAAEWLHRHVVVPAVIPCGRCEACRAGRGAVCPAQVFPGNDVHGGFGTHVRVPATGLCPVPDLAGAATNPAGVSLPMLAVVADAISTPYHAIHRSGLAAGDLAVVVGVGGIGGFGVQIAAALGATVVALDREPSRLDRIARHGAALTLRTDTADSRTLRREVRSFAEARGISTWRTTVFEMSGAPQGQVLAFDLLGPGATLMVVGFTPAKVELRLSNLMAFDARAQGSWGCPPQSYPPVVDLVLSGQVVLEPFIERRPLASINDTFREIHNGGLARRVVLIPDS